MMCNFCLAIFIASLAVLVPSGSLPASALSCALPLFSEAFEQHDLLLHGRLVEKEMQVSANSFQKTAYLTFETIHVYKGEYQDDYTIRADLSWDDLYREGGEYILFADKDGDTYIRDLCVGDYIATPSIIAFLDGYQQTGESAEVRSLYDLVWGFERDDLDLLITRYNTLNRGDDALREVAQRGGDYEYTCDFVADLNQSAKYLENVGAVKAFNRQNPNGTITFEYNLGSDPPVATITYDGPNGIAQIRVMQAKNLGNCFAVYDSKLIDKATGDVVSGRNELDTICGSQEGHNLLPDLCPFREYPSPLRNGVVITGILAVLVIGTAGGALVYVAYRRKR